MIPRALVVSILATAALTPLSAHGAVTKIPVTLAFSSANENGSIKGQVTSAKARCVNRVDVHGQNDLAHLSTSTDDQGNFTLSYEFLADLGFEDFDAYVRQGPRFGRAGRRKQCGRATGSVDFTFGITDIDTIGFDDSTNTLSGTLSSAVAACSNNAPLELSYKGAGMDEYVLDRTFSSGDGAYSVPYGAEPAPALWGVFPTPFIGASSFGTANASVTYCDPGFGKAYEISE